MKRDPSFPITSVNTVFNGVESISFLRPKIWNLLLSDLNSIDDLENFKKSLKNGKLRAAHVDCAKYIYKISI